ncbi:hypothetical protein [Desulfospira joergensenii]|uniref:hypothetical protein n=1 Tax=Desulfospira joergensenii TaxID=53329 RepID=UPI0003B37E68|nr:hypothetical protein [Desulfospira joergensenii]
MKTKYHLYPVIPAVILFSMVLFGGQNLFAAKDGLKTVAIVPFEINAAQDMAPVRKGILHMLYSRLSWRDNVMVLPQHKIDKKLAAFGYSSGIEMDDKQIAEIAQTLQSDFILTGSITQFDNAFSIDTKIFDIANKRFMAFSQHSEKSDNLIDKVDRIAATINQKVFQRDTLTWDKIEQERQANIEKMKRKNPEYMMQNPNWQETKESYGWKIWKYLF